MRASTTHASADEVAWAHQAAQLRFFVLENRSALVLGE